MKKGVLRNFTKFTGKHLCQSLRPATLLNTRLWHRCFTVNFAKFLSTPFLQKTSGRLLLNLSLKCWFWEAAALILIIKLQTFIYRTPTVAASEFLWQQILFCSWILYLFADSRTCFCSGRLWKHELNLRSSHWSCSVKKVFLENLQISQENDCVEVSF